MNNSAEDLTTLILENSINLDKNKLPELINYSKIILNNYELLNDVSIFNLKKFTKLIFNISQCDNSLVDYYPLLIKLNNKGAKDSNALYHLLKRTDLLKLESHFHAHSAEMGLKSFIHLNQDLTLLDSSLKNIDISNKISKSIGDFKYFGYRLIQKSLICELYYNSTLNYDYFKKSENSLELAIDLFSKLNLEESKFEAKFNLGKIKYHELKSNEFNSVKLARNVSNIYLDLVNYYSSKEKFKEKFVLSNLYLGSSFAALSNLRNDKKYAKKAITAFSSFIRTLKENEELMNFKNYSNEIKKASRHMDILSYKFFKKYIRFD